MSAEIPIAIAKATPETAAMSLAASQVRYVFAAMQIGTTAAIAEALKNIPPETMGEIAIGAFLVTLAVGYLYEVETLKKSGFTINEGTSIAHLKVENPYMATFLGNLYGQLSYFINPVDMGATLTSLSIADGNHLIYANLLARTIIGFSYTMGLNYAIQKGASAEMVEKFKSVKETAIAKMDSFFEATGIAAIDRALYPPTYYAAKETQNSHFSHIQGSYLHFD